MSDPKRIGFKLGRFSGSSQKNLNGAKPPQQARPSSTLGKRPRSHAFDPDSDAEDDEITGKQEAVTSLGALGVEDETRRIDKNARGTQSAAIAIPCQMSELDTKIKTRKPRPNDKDALVKETEPADHDKERIWGLTVTKKAAPERSTTDKPGDPEPDLVGSSREGDPNSAGQGENIDQTAMDALLGKYNGKKRLTITEDDALKRDTEKAGEVSTIEEYEQIPDGEFGAAILRGMGWNGKPIETVYAKRAKRAKHLGLGAKEDEEIKRLELAKKNGHRSRAPRPDEYRKNEDAKRQQREERDQTRHKHDHKREKNGHSYSRRRDDRDRDRDRDRERDGHRPHGRDSRR